MKLTEEYTCSSVEALDEIAIILLHKYSGRHVFAFYGEMGAGKTTFIKVLCKKLGVLGLTSSPSFTIVNEYRNSSDEAVFHLDFYRIKNLDEAYDIGYEEYFFSGAYCFIEWPEKIETLLPVDHVRIQIRMGNDENSRIFIF